LAIREADSHLLDEWKWLLRGYKVVGGGPLGDLILERKNQYFFFDINAAKLELIKDEHRLPDQFLMENFVKRMEEAGLSIRNDECYAFKIPVIVGGAFDGDNVYVGKWDEYNRWMASFHRQVKDVPDGAKIVIKVTE
jgi:hypothetical protein